MEQLQATNEKMLSEFPTPLLSSSNFNLACRFFLSDPCSVVCPELEEQARHVVPPPAVVAHGCGDNTGSFLVPRGHGSLHHHSGRPTGADGDLGA